MVSYLNSVSIASVGAIAAIIAWWNELYCSASKAILLRRWSNIGFRVEQYRFVCEAILLSEGSSRACALLSVLATSVLPGAAAF